MIANIKLSTKHLHKFLYKTKTCLKNVFKKSHPFTKGSVGACMQILNLTIQRHTTAKDKNLYMCYKNIILGEKNSIASSHSSKLSVSTVLIRSYGWYKAMLSANLPFYSSLKDLVLRGSLVFHCSYINTVSVGRDATSKRRPETISGLRRTKQMPHIKTKWTPTSSMSTYNTAQTVWIHPEVIPDHSVCLCVHVLYVFSHVYIHLGLLVCVWDTQSDFHVLRHNNTLTYRT